MKHSPTTEHTNRSRSTRWEPIARFIAGVAATMALIAGVAIPAGAIVNGTASSTGQRPYQVSLQSGGSHFCGGTIINATTIVTAAHCLEGETAAGITIRAGVTNVNSNGGQDRPVSSVISHPQYSNTGVADIAVVTLAEPLALGGNVQAIPLATQAQVNAATTGVVSGWGAVSENGADSNQLLETTVPIVSDASCATQLDISGPAELCAGGNGNDSCYGDSGGPLVVETANGPALGGVVSWGEECAGPTPGVYADIPGLTNWVNGAQSGTAPATVAPPTPVTPAPSVPAPVTPVAPAPVDEDFNNDDFSLDNEDLYDEDEDPYFADDDFSYEDDDFSDWDDDLYFEDDGYLYEGDFFDWDDEDLYFEDEGYLYEDDDLYTDWDDEDFHYEDDDLYTDWDDDDFHYEDDDDYTDWDDDSSWDDQDW